MKSINLTVFGIGIMESDYWTEIWNTGHTNYHASTALDSRA